MKEIETVAPVVSKVNVGRRSLRYTVLYIQIEYLMFFIIHSEEIGVLEAKDSDNSRRQLQKLSFIIIKR